MTICLVLKNHFHNTSNKLNSNYKSMSNKYWTNHEDICSVRANLHCRFSTQTPYQKPSYKLNSNKNLMSYEYQTISGEIQKVLEICQICLIISAPSYFGFYILRRCRFHHNLIIGLPVAGYVLIKCIRIIIFIILKGVQRC